MPEHKSRCLPTPEDVNRHHRADDEVQTARHRAHEPRHHSGSSWEVGRQCRLCVCVLRVWCGLPKSVSLLFPAEGKCFRFLSCQARSTRSHVNRSAARARPAERCLLEVAQPWATLGNFKSHKGRESYKSQFSPIHKHLATSAPLHRRSRSPPQSK